MANSDNSLRREHALHRREKLAIAAPSAFLVAAAMWLAFQFVEPGPPRLVKMSTGAATGAFHQVAKRYAEILARNGVTLELLTSKGSRQNATRLIDAASGVKVALVQGGAVTAAEGPQLLSLGRVYQQPLWIFYRGEAPLTRLSDFRGKRLAIGPEGSGTRGLAQKLLEAAKVSAETATLSGPDNDAAADQLVKGEIDAMLMATGADSLTVKRLLGEPGVKLMSIGQAEAILRRNGDLGKVVLPAGVIDLAGNVPDSDVVMVAPQASLLVRDDLHPAIVGLLVAAAKEVHAPAGMFQRQGEFPIPSDPGIPMSRDAVRAYESGATLLQRHLPFWVATFLERTIVLLIPLATILLPMIKIAPWLYQWRVRRRIWHWYGQLKRVESRLETAEPGAQAGLSGEIDRIAEAASRIPVPARYAGELYHLREHVELVRQRIARGV